MLGFRAQAQDNADDALIEDLESQMLTQVQGNQLSENENIKRVEDSLRLSRALDDARKLLEGGDISRAQNRLDDIISKTSATGAYSEYYLEAREMLAQVYGLRALQAERQGNWAVAREDWQSAVQYDPNNKSYQRKLKEAAAQSKTVKEKYDFNSVADQELFDKVTEIQRLVFEGDSYYRTGQYAKASASYNKILKIDPYNKVAFKRIERLENRKEVAVIARREVLKEQRMREIEEAWSTSIGPKTPEVDTISSNAGATSEIGNIYNKLESIVIPSLNFKDINIFDAVDFLREQSIALDPEGKGVNIVLKTESTFGVAEGEESIENSEDITFSLDVVNQPLITILDFIKDLTPLKYEVENFAVFILTKNEVSDELLIKTYAVPPNFFSVTPKVEEDGEFGSSVSYFTADVKDQLAQKGVNFPQGSTASYLPKTAKMVVKNTLDQLNLIQQLLSEQSPTATQIEIETKYVEFTEDRLKDFSFNWQIAADGTIPDGVIPFNPLDGDGDLFPDLPLDTNGNIIPGGGAIAAGTGLRTSADLAADSIDARLGNVNTRVPATIGVSAILDGNGARMLLTALESKLGADLLSAPKVTVLNNEQTKIRIAREFLYPTDFEPPQIATTQGNNNNNNNNNVFVALPPLVVPPTPEEFEMRDVGVVLEVRANASPDRRIELDLNSDVTEFQGFINYGFDSTFAEIDGIGNLQLTGVAAEGLAIMPVFSVRKIETKVQVIDGQTVVLGGFIRDDYDTIEDKVPILGDIPLLGRLFRSETERSIKRNLVIFITARMINADGTPRFLTQAEAEEFGIEL
ncbi:MAG: hypothetical protein AAFY98_10010 [Verrucomicrobiota bacterium]